MNPIFQNIRVGHTYKVTNNGERAEFLVLKRLGDNNFLVKSTTSLESFQLEELIRYGVGKDFAIEEKLHY